MALASFAINVKADGWRRGALGDEFNLTFGSVGKTGGPFLASSPLVLSSGRRLWLLGWFSIAFLLGLLIPTAHLLGRRFNQGQILFGRIQHVHLLPGPAMKDFLDQVFPLQLFAKQLSQLSRDDARILPQKLVLFQFDTGHIIQVL